MAKGKREALSDWLMMLGGPILVASLFMPWSHQFSSAFLADYGRSPALQGIPRDPTAWQVYSSVDVLLAVLGGALVLVALRGPRPARIAVLLGLGVALAFTIHALGSPPTNGADLLEPGAVLDHPASGPGEVGALLGVGLGLAGVLLSFTVD